MTTKAVDVLLVTTRIDAASDAVADALAEAGVDFYRLNTEDLPFQATSSIEFVTGEPGARWCSDGRGVSLDRVQRVWYRRHRLPALPPETIPAHAEYCLRESQWYLRGVLWNLAEQLPASNWMSHPADIQRAESKILQLRMAARVGFAVPDTLVSNDPIEIRSFFRRQNGALVAKPLRLGYFNYGDVQTAAYTTALKAADLEHDDALRAAPVIYQRLLEKSCDIRITVVGDATYAAAVVSRHRPVNAL